MDVLKEKYKTHKEAVQQTVDVSKELLTLLTREGLLDIADCVKFQGITNKKKKTHALITLLTDRRTDRAYAILVSCLREVGQTKAADLLTDIGEETQLIAQLKNQLDAQIESVGSFLDIEEKRAGLESQDCGHTQTVRHAVPTTDKEVWLGTQDSMRRAVDQLERCQAVIQKLHNDCQQVADTNGVMNAQTRDCYFKLSNLMRADQKLTTEKAPREAIPTGDLLKRLLAEVNEFLANKTAAALREHQDRTTVMRTLRHVRDWIMDRASILNTFLASLSPNGRTRLALTGQTATKDMQKYARSPGLIGSSPNSSFPMNESTNFLGTKQSLILTERDAHPATLESEHDGRKTFEDLNSSTALETLPQPFAASTPQPQESTNQPQNMEATNTAHTLEIFESNTMGSVYEGVKIVERQLREYIHLEIMLTDKLRHELRMKHHQRKSLGFSSKGLSEAQGIARKLSMESTADNASQLQSHLDRISKDYDECCRCIDKVSASMVKIDDVDRFMTMFQEKENQCNKNQKSKPEKRKELPKLDKKSKSKANAKYEHKDPLDPLVDFLQGSNPRQRAIPMLDRTGKQNKKISMLFPPDSRSPRGREAPTQYDSDLCTKLKLLVANYEIVRARMLTLEARARREVSKVKWKAEAMLKARDEEIFLAQTLLREATAEKDKYRKLYENTKIASSRK